MTPSEGLPGRIKRQVSDGAPYIQIEPHEVVHLAFYIKEHVGRAEPDLQMEEIMYSIRQGSVRVYNVPVVVKQ